MSRGERNLDAEVYRLSQRSKQQTRRQERPEKQDCYRCGDKHDPQYCRFKNQQCRLCKKYGHIARACKSGQQQTPGHKSNNKYHRKPTHHIEGDTEGSDTEILRLHRITDSQNPPIYLDLLIEGKPISMELDTGASYSIISKKTLQDLGIQKPLTPSRVRLVSYSGHEIAVLGIANVQVKYEGKKGLTVGS